MNMPMDLHGLIFFIKRVRQCQLVKEWNAFSTALYLELSLMTTGYYVSVKAFGVLMHFRIAIVQN